jgi:sugar lactone lactonase YvrE
MFYQSVAGEAGAWAMVAGADGTHVYFGTTPHARIMRVDWKTKQLIDVGRPSNSKNASGS